MLDYISQIAENFHWQELIIKPFKTGLRNQTNSEFISNDFSPSDLRIRIQKFAISLGERLDPTEPFSSGLIDSPSLRWVAMIPPVSGEPELIVRKTIGSNISEFSGYDGIQNDLSKIFSLKKHLLIAAPSGYGKTTLLKKILFSFFNQERVVILDSFQEWDSLSPLWSMLRETPGLLDGRGRQDMRTLFSMSLRMSADRLVLGEIRDREKEIFRQLCLVGHGSVLSTIHGSSLQELRQRLGAMENCYALFIEKNFMLNKELTLI